MIYFIKKTIGDDNEVKIEYQYFKSLEKCIEKINDNKAIVPQYIISSTMAIYDIKYDDSIVIITNDQNLKIVADILMNGIKNANKSDEFILSTIQDIHSDKIKSVSSAPSIMANKSHIEKLVNQCRDECLYACANGISTSKNISLAFFELKCSLGLNVSSPQNA